MARRQLEFVREKDLGFDREQVVVMQIGYKGVFEHRMRLAERLRQHPAVTHALGIRHPPPTTMDRAGTFTMEGMENVVPMDFTTSDPGFLKLFGIRLLAGQDNDERPEGRSRTTFVINEAAVWAFGFDDQRSPLAGLRPSRSGIQMIDMPKPMGRLQVGQMRNIHNTDSVGYIIRVVDRRDYERPVRS